MFPLWGSVMLGKVQVPRMKTELLPGRALVGRWVLPAACLGWGVGLHYRGREGARGLLLSLWPRGAPSM